MTDSQRKILDALHAHPASTARDLAGHTGLAYSTITALLRGTLSESGHVCRDANTWSANKHGQPGEPDLTAESSAPDSLADAFDPVPEPNAEPAGAAHPDDLNTGAAHTPAHDAQAGAAATLQYSEPAAGTAPGHSDTTARQDASGDDSTGDNDIEPGNAAPDGEQATTGKRLYRKSGLAPLGKGGLQQHILKVLRATPDEQWKITPLTRHLTGVVGKKVSAGAVVQACNKLAARGELIQTVDKPATFKAA